MVMFRLSLGRLGSPKITIHFLTDNDESYTGLINDCSEKIKSQMFKIDPFDNLFRPVKCGWFSSHPVESHYKPSYEVNPIGFRYRLDFCG